MWLSKRRNIYGHGAHRDDRTASEDHLEYEVHRVANCAGSRHAETDLRQMEHPLKTLLRTA